MPWREISKVESRMLFVKAVESRRWSFSRVCRRFGITRVTGYKWMRRYWSEGEQGLYDRSRRPHAVTCSTDGAVVDALLEEREAHPYWGARKLCKLLERRGIASVPERTANRILKRAGLVEPRIRREAAVGRFERPRPNDLWQIDHKAAIHGKWARRCVPFVVLDDHSRYLVGLDALPDKGLVSTWRAMWEVLGRHGLPKAVLSDNDSVFHGGNGPSQFEVRLMRLEIAVLHGRPYHPETQGKVERFNGTLERELLRDGCFETVEEVQKGFDGFRWEYNFYRPHESLSMEVPGSIYRPSRRERPQELPQMEYPSGAVLRKVDKDGWVRWKGAKINVGRGLFKEWVEVREGAECVEVYYGPNRISGARPEGANGSGKEATGGGNPASAYGLSRVPPASNCIPCRGTTCKPCHGT
ncbi:MAG: IS481 family transposase [Planctomycetes bacterium]|nr:IS481 family transposase [Planctomycetota bacterium]